MIKVKRISFFLLALTLTGCATTGVEKVEKLPTGHQIVVLSVLGNDLNVQTTGTTIFTNWQRTQDVSDWNIDAKLEDFIRNELTRAGKFIAVAADTADVRKTVGAVTQNEWTSKLEVEGGMESLSDFATSAGADSVILVGSHRKQDFIFNTNQYIEGYGIYQRSGLFGSKKAVDYAIVYVWLVESGSDIARVLKFHHSPRQESEWVEKDGQLSPGKQHREEIEALLKLAVGEALTELTLR